jgi:hypothetical protein
MPMLNTTIIETVKETMKTQLTNIATGKGRTGKDIVRENLTKVQNQSEVRHRKIMNKFIEEEGKGVKVNVDV